VQWPVGEIGRDEEDLPTWRRIADRSALKSEGRIKKIDGGI